MTNDSSYPKGSEWSKWDLQVQTILDDRYVSLSKYSEELKKRDSERWREYAERVGGEKNALLYDSKEYFNDNAIPKKDRCVNYARNVFSFLDIFSVNLGCIVFTDHNYFDDRLIDALVEHSQKASAKALSGVEVNVGGVHVIVVFKSPPFSKATFSEGIRAFLSEIGIHHRSSGGGALTVCTKHTLSGVADIVDDLGGMYLYPHCNSDNGLFQERPKTDRTYLRDVFNHKNWIVLQSQNKGSLEKLQQYISSKRDSLKANAIYTIASDARALRDIGKTDENGNSCWIKANPTFEGLKQIIYEPIDRLHLGEEPPTKVDRARLIESISIYGAGDWFENGLHLSLNEGLVTVVGGKGTGKTALLDLIAFATGSYTGGQTSFLTRTAGALDGAKVVVNWAVGHPQKSTVSMRGGSKTEATTRYLSQSFVEQLCSEGYVDELRAQIESVIFQSIPSEDKARYVDFATYCDAQLKVVRDRRARLVRQLSNANEEIYETKRLIGLKAQASTDVEKLDRESERLRGELEQLTKGLARSKKRQQQLTQLKQLKETKAELEKRISELRAEVLRAEEVRNKITEYLEDADEFIQTIKGDLKGIGFKAPQLAQLKVCIYPTNLDSLVVERSKKISRGVVKAESELSSVDKYILAIDKALKIEKTKSDKIKVLETQLGDTKRKKDAITKRLSEISMAEKALPKRTKERGQLYFSLIEILHEERRKLTELFSPVSQVLQHGGKEQKLFEFVVVFSFDAMAMAERGDELIDHTKKGRFFNKTKQALIDELKKCSLSPSLDGEILQDSDKEEVRMFIESVQNLFVEDELKDKHTIQSQIKPKRTEKEFDDWLYSPSYFSVNYSIRFAGTDLDNLSPGLKGVALMILYLELDKADNRPILIDQPEENLDNRSVYQTLVGYFTEAKKRRQVIVVTHNPNLVVNTDSEQVIVANYDREKEAQPSVISYRSGALENCDGIKGSKRYLDQIGIRQHICEILEGGEDAFLKRERKYGFGNG